MNVKWLIEDFHQDNNFQALADEIKKQGMECVVAKYLPFASGGYDVYPETDCVLFQGSIQMAMQLQREQKWVPGVWCNWEGMRCSSYYAHCGKYLLNQGYMMMPLNEVVRRRDELFEIYGGAFFLRPDSGAKSFTGTLIFPEDFKTESRDFNQWRWVMNNASATDLVVVAPPKHIKREWRVVVAENKAITGCQYKADEKLSVSPDCPDTVIQLAEQAAHDFAPDPMYVVDMCECNDTLYLLEIGAFSVAGLYALNMEKIVEVAAKLAKAEFEDIYGLNHSNEV